MRACVRRRTTWTAGAKVEAADAVARLATSASSMRRVIICSSAGRGCAVSGRQRAHTHPPRTHARTRSGRARPGHGSEPAAGASAAPPSQSAHACAATPATTPPRRGPDFSENAAAAVLQVALCLDDQTPHGALVPRAGAVARGYAAPPTRRVSHAARTQRSAPAGGAARIAALRSPCACA